MSARKATASVAASSSRSSSFPCRECKGTGVDRKFGVACVMCQGAKAITWDVFEERCATIQKLAADLLAADKEVRALKARVKALEDKHADVDYVVEDYLATLQRQVRAEALANLGRQPFNS